MIRIFLLTFCILLSFAVFGQSRLPYKKRMAKLIEKREFEKVLMLITKIQYKHGNSPYTYDRRGYYRTNPDLYYYRLKARFEIFKRDSNEAALKESMKDYARAHVVSKGCILRKDSSLHKELHDLIASRAEHALTLHKLMIAEQYSHFLAVAFEDTIPAYRKIYIPLYDVHKIFSASELDSFARQEPTFQILSVRELAEYLTKGLSTDEEKAWVIYLWICTHIHYNYLAYEVNQTIDPSALRTIFKRLTMCSGYANLFLELCNNSGLKAVMISGMALGGKYNKWESHAYNAVFLNGKWRLIDSTWGASSYDYKKYFCADPKEFSKTHTPFDSQYLFLDQ